MRFGYASNGQAVTLVHGESWDESDVCNSYDIPWAKEFRYDSGRARYLVSTLDPAQLEGGTFDDTARIWTDYDGDDP